MSGRIWKDARTGKYGGCVHGNGDTLDIGEHDFEYQAQLAYLSALHHDCGTLPFDVLRDGRPLPATEGIETPNPLAEFATEQLCAEMDRRLKITKKGP